jgi:hypothetical protein
LHSEIAVAGFRPDAGFRIQPAINKGPETRDISWEALERQDWRLWILAILLMLVLGISLLSFMFPTVFWFGAELPVKAPQRAFVGFTVLLALVLVYMLQRQASVRHLKRELYQALLAVAEGDRKADIQALASLPGAGQFHDSLAMEYLRASHAGGRLGVVLLAAEGCSEPILGRIGALLHTMLRPGETLFRIETPAFGMILPNVPPDNLSALAKLMEERVSAVGGGAAVRLSSATYPDQVSSLAQFEALLREAAQ